MFTNAHRRWEDFSLFLFVLARKDFIEGKVGSLDFNL